MKYLILIPALFMTGCLKTLEEKGAEVMDSAAVGAERVICNDLSVGAVMRNYCSTQEGCDRYMDFCFATGDIGGAWNEIKSGLQE